MEKRDFWHKFKQEAFGVSLAVLFVVLIILPFAAPDFAKFVFIPLGIYLTIDTLEYIGEKFSR